MPMSAAPAAISSGHRNMRDWLKAFRPASFRGVGFKVDMEETAGARRLSISPIAYSNQSVIEDMGAPPRRFDLTAYVAGDIADAQATAFSAALGMKGAGLLMLPMLGAVRARVMSWRLSRQLRLAGYVAFSIELIEEGLASVPFGPVPGAGPISDLLLGGIGHLTSALAVAFPSSARGHATIETGAASLAASRLAAVAAGAVPGAALSPELSAAVDALALAAASPSPAVAGAMVEGWNVLAMTADPATGRRAMAGAVAALDLDAAVVGFTGIAEASAMASAFAVLTVRDDYAAQQDAARARSGLAEAIAPVLEAAGVLGDASFGWLSSVTGTAALTLSRVAASRAPLVRVETPISLSAIRAAYDLYGDANRASELVDRNHASTPAFMPLAFEALAA
jgi:prophage DNA circulation protein